MRGHGHDALFRAGHLIFGQGAAVDTVGASGFDLLLEQSRHGYTSKGMCVVIITHICVHFHTFFSRRGPQVRLRPETAAKARRRLRQSTEEWWRHRGRPVFPPVQ